MFNKKMKVRERDIDQIAFDIKNKQNTDPLFCEYCDRAFINDHFITLHKRTKKHKRRIKILKEKTYSHKEANLAGGLLS